MAALRFRVCSPYHKCGQTCRIQESHRQEGPPFSQGNDVLPAATALPPASAVPAHLQTIAPSYTGPPLRNSSAAQRLASSPAASEASGLVQLGVRRWREVPHEIAMTFTTA